MAATPRIHFPKWSPLLLPALILTGAAGFAVGFLIARGAEQELQPDLRFWVFTLLCGLSAVAWSAPAAMAAWQQRPDKARSVFWKESGRAVVLRFVGGACMGVGTLHVLWSIAAFRSLPDFWAWAFFFVSIGFGSRWWRLADEVLEGAPRAARNAWRDYKSFKRAAHSKRKPSGRKHN